VSHGGAPLKIGNSKEFGRESGRFRALRSAAPLKMKRGLAYCELSLYSFSRMQMVFEIPDDLVEALGADSCNAEARVRCDLAVHYYQCGLLAVGRAAAFAGMPRGDFEKILSERSVDRPYQASDLAHELNFQG